MHRIIETTNGMRLALTRFARANHNDIIATSPWVQGHGDLPHRIVLRDTGSDWIVHRQIIHGDDTGAFFSAGSYFHKSGPDLDKVFACAWRTFVARSVRHLGIEPDEERDES